MTKEEMLAKISAKTKKFNNEKEKAQKDTVCRIQALVDKVKESLPKLKDTYEILMALKGSMEYSDFNELFVSNTDNMDPSKDEVDCTIGIQTSNAYFGFYYRYKEDGHARTNVHLYINLEKEEVCSFYDGWLTNIPIDEVSINTMFPRLDLYHHQVLLEKFEKLVNEIDPYIERVARFVEAY